ncbi:MAG: DUF1993 family protein, partial [Pseudomonadota bacterium]
CRPAGLQPRYPMAQTFDDTVPQAIRHYLDRIGALLAKLDGPPDGDARLATRLAPDMFETGFHLAVAIRFAARALGPPNGIEVPDIPEDASVADLRRYHQEIAILVAPLSAPANGTEIIHQAGDAVLRQDPADYVARFAFPSMIFHFGIAYAALRADGLAIGKADFDGLHRYDDPT